MNVTNMVKDQSADWAYLPSKDCWTVSYRATFGPMEETAPHGHLIKELRAAGADDEADWAESFRLDILGPLAEEPEAKEWLREFDPPIMAGDGLGEILAERKILEQGIALFSDDPSMVTRRETQIRLAKPAFYEDTGAVVWAGGAARSWI